MCDCDTPKRANFLYAEELNRLNQAAAHNDIAFAAAFHFCATEGKNPPPGLMAAVDRLLIELLKGEKSKRRGRAAGRIARCRQDLWDFERWCAVEEIRTLRRQNAEDLKTLESLSPEERKQVAHVPKVRAWLLHGTFECASMSLAGTFAWGGPDAVRASYRRVSRAMATRSNAGRYYMFPGDFLGRVGIPYPLTPVVTGKKWVPFYDLKP